MDLLLFSLLISLGVAGINYLFFHKKLMWWMMPAQALGCFALVMAIGAGISGSKKVDTQVFNGSITKKWREEVHCRHSYKCNCYYTTECSGSGKDRRCHQVEHCQTCYRHPYDVDWNVSATLGYTNVSFDIATLDSQGLQQPPRWTAVEIGEPYARTGMYANYIKANKDSVFNKQNALLDKYKAVLPQYPMQVYDYYRINRTVDLGVGVPADFNQKLSAINSQLGPAKQCNIVAVFVKNQPAEYFNALEGAWIGGKKNDIVPVICVDDNNNILWADVLAWSKSDYFKVKLRDAILDMKTMTNYDALISAIQTNVSQSYQRKRMREFEYLNKTIILTSGEFYGLIILCLVLSIAISVWLNMADYRGQEESRSRWYN